MQDQDLLSQTVLIESTIDDDDDYVDYDYDYYYYYS